MWTALIYRLFQYFFSLPSSFILLPTPTQNPDYLLTILLLNLLSSSCKSFQNEALCGGKRVAIQELHK